MMDVIEVIYEISMIAFGLLSLIITCKINKSISSLQALDIKRKYQPYLALIGLYFSKPKIKYSLDANDKCRAPSKLYYHFLDSRDEHEIKRWMDNYDVNKLTSRQVNHYRNNSCRFYQYSRDYDDKVLETPFLVLNLLPPQAGRVYIAHQINYLRYKNLGYPITQITIKECDYNLPNGKTITLNANNKYCTICRYIDTNGEFEMPLTIVSEVTFDGTCLALEKSTLTSDQNTLTISLDDGLIAYSSFIIRLSVMNLREEEVDMNIKLEFKNNQLSSKTLVIE